MFGNRGLDDLGRLFALARGFEATGQSDVRHGAMVGRQGSIGVLRLGVFSRLEKLPRGLQPRRGSFVDGR
jgi:hypothetical protein